MPAWFDHVEAACAAIDVRPTYAFVVSAGDETLPILRDRAPFVALTTVTEPPYVERQWHRRERIDHMVYLRNTLLQTVRRIGPDVFVSVDSDVLLHPMAIADMVEGLGRFAAVGGSTFLTPMGDRFPSCGWVLGKDGLRRRPIEHRGVIPVGVIMAVKAMGPAAYAVDYRHSPQGEDIGWSLAAAQAGLKLGWDNRHSSKHVMSPEALARVDERCGF